MCLGNFNIIKQILIKPKFNYGNVYYKSIFTLYPIFFIYNNSKINNNRQNNNNNSNENENFHQFP